MDHRRVITSSSSTLEQHWIDEVRYLHSLWHQGPPQNPRSSTTVLPSPTIPTETPKKNNKKRRRNNKMKEVVVEEEKEEEKTESKSVEEVTEFSWPIEVIPDSRNQTGWPEPVTHLGRRELSVEEQTIVGALQLQQKGLKASQDFFSKSKDSDGEHEEEDGYEVDEDDDDDDFVEDDSEETEEFKFFLGVFTQDNELRSYYEKNYESGEFCCLVCGGIGKKNWKRFKDCVALVQHSTAVSKTKRKRAHRAFGQVLCRVLGWEFKRIPNIVLSSTEPLGRGLAQANDTQVVHEEDGDKVEEPVKLGNEDGVQDEQLRDKVEGSANPVNVGGDQNVEILDKDEGSVNLNNESGDQNKELLDKVEGSANPVNVGGDQNVEILDKDEGSLNLNNESGDQNKELLDKVEGSENLDNGDNAQNQNKVEESVNLDQGVGDHNEELCDKAIGSVDATINGLTLVECEVDRKDDDANDQRKDNDKENVTTNGANSGEQMDLTVSSKIDGPDPEHQEQENIYKELIDIVNVKEELVDRSG